MNSTTPPYMNGFTRVVTMNRISQEMTFHHGLNKHVLIWRGVLIVSIGFLAGCMHQYVEYADSFVLRGRVLDKESHIPISDVAIHVRTKEREDWNRFVVYTDNTGNFNATYQHRRGERVPIFPAISIGRDPAEYFKRYYLLTCSKHGYETRKLEISDAISQDDSKITIEFGDILMSCPDHDSGDT